MSNHTYYVSLHRAYSRRLATYRLFNVGGKNGFFNHRRLYYIVKPRRRRYLNMNLFQEQLKEGKVGETLVYNWLTSRGYHVYDVSNDADWQAEDVDFLAFSADDVLKIEVKKDNNANWSGNVICELISDMKTGKDGWFRTCKADRLIVVMAPSKFLIIDLPTMQRRIETNNHRCGLSELISAGIAEICLI